MICPRAPSAQMLASPAYNALAGSSRSSLRVLLEELAASDGRPVQLSTAYFEAAGISASALSTATRELVAIGFVEVRTSGTATRESAPCDGWRAVVDHTEAERRLAAAKTSAAARVLKRRRRAAVAADHAGDGGSDDAGGVRLPEGVRRSRYPAMPWEGGAQ